jgi:Bacterial antitoxin of type II TA system, VapB
MLITLTLDDVLLAKAAKLAGPLELSALVSAGLTAFIERESASRLAKLGGSQPTLSLAPRRRAKTSR